MISKFQKTYITNIIFKHFAFYHFQFNFGSCQSEFHRIFFTFPNYFHINFCTFFTLQKFYSFICCKWQNIFSVNFCNFIFYFNSNFFSRTSNKWRNNFKRFSFFLANSHSNPNIFSIHIFRKVIKICLRQIFRVRIIQFVYNSCNSTFIKVIFTWSRFLSNKIILNNINYIYNSVQLCCIFCISSTCIFVISRCFYYSSCRK